jgi:Tol biopolymer transport system component
VDTAGNTELTKSATVQIDKTTPTVTIDSPKNETYNTNTIDLSATANENIVTWTYSLDGGEPTTVGGTPVTEDWWNQDYQYRKTINIEGITTDDYTLSVPVDTGICQATNCADLRVVTDASGSLQEIDRIIDAGTVSFMANHEGNYWLYYGNPTAVNSPADGNNVYFLYDDFTGADGSDVDSSIWEAVNEGDSQLYIQNNMLRMYSPRQNYHDAYMRSIKDIGDTTGLEIEFDMVSWTPGINSEWLVGLIGSNNIPYNWVYWSGQNFRVKDGAPWAQGYFEVVLDETTVLTQSQQTPQNHYKLVSSGGLAEVYRDGTLIWAGTWDRLGDFKLVVITAGGGTYGETITTYFDNFKVRKHLEDEPTTSLGEEEVKSDGSSGNVDGPVGHWKFDEGSGTTAADSAGPYSGAINSATWTDGKCGNALSFDGADDYIGLGSGLSNLQEFTFSAWINIDDSASGIRTILGSWHGYQDGDRKFSFGLTDDNRMQVRLSSCGSWTCEQFLESDGAITQTNTWHHMTAVYDTTDVEFYIDGVLDSVYNTNQHSLLNHGLDVEIGRSPWDVGMHYFDGSIDEVLVYNRALSAAEVTSLYNEGQNCGTSQGQTTTQSLNTLLSNLEDGQHHVTVHATDLAGNMNSSTVYFTVDTTPPEVTISSPENKIYNISTTDLSATSNEDVSTWSYALDGGDPVTVQGGSQGGASIESFEDGDWTTNPEWTWNTESYSSIQTAYKKSGDNALRIALPDSYSNQGYCPGSPECVIASAQTSVTGDEYYTYSTWVMLNYRSEMDWKFALRDGSNAVVTAGMAGFGTSGDSVHCITPDSHTSRNIGTGGRSNHWYKAVIEYNPVQNKADCYIYDSDGTSIVHSAMGIDTQGEVDNIAIMGVNRMSYGGHRDFYWDDITLPGDGTTTSTLNAVLENLPDGPHNVVVTATDLADNEGSSSVDFTVDTLPPTITITGVPEGYTNEAVTPIIDVTDANLNTVSITLNGEPFTSGTTITADGAYVLEVHADDLAGNPAEQSVEFIIDQTPPEVTVTSPENKIYAANTIDLSATVNEDVSTWTYSLDGADPVTVGAGPSGGSGTALLDDDFESYNSGTFPSPGGWIGYYSAHPPGTIVTSAHAREGEKSFQIDGQNGAMWAAELYKPMSFPNDFSVDLSMMGSGEIDSVCCHWWDISISLSEYFHGGGAGYTTLAIFGRGHTFNGANGNIGSYDHMRWYDIHMEVSLEDGTVDYWVDGEYVGQQYNSRLQTQNFIGLYLGSGSGKGWIDNVKVYEGSSASQTSRDLNVVLENLPDGPHNVVVQATDLADNDGSSSVDFTIDTTPPEVTIESPLNKTYNVSTIDLSATANENIATWSYSLDDGEPVTVSGATAEGDWWDSNYQYRQQVTIENNADSIMEAGYTVDVDITGITGSLANGDDIRVVYNGVELDRALGTGTVTFATQAGIAAGASDSNYYVYYGNAEAGAPPADENNVYLLDGGLTDYIEVDPLNKITIDYDENKITYTNLYEAQTGHVYKPLPEPVTDFMLEYKFNVFQRSGRDCSDFVAFGLAQEVGGYSEPAGIRNGLHVGFGRMVVGDGRLAIFHRENGVGTYVPSPTPIPFSYNKDYWAVLSRAGTDVALHIYEDAEHQLEIPDSPITFTDSNPQAYDYSYAMNNRDHDWVNLCQMSGEIVKVTPVRKYLSQEPTTSLAGEESNLNSPLPEPATNPELIQLTDSNNNEMYASWSPDSEEITYLSDESVVIPTHNERAKIYRTMWKVESDGAGETVQLSDHLGYALKWSPDGAEIVFEGAATNCPREGSVWKMSGDGTGLTELSASDCNTDYLPRWSPDGTKIAYTTEINGWFRIRTMNSDGTGKAEITSPQSATTEWSPDGTKIAYKNPSDLWVMNSDGSGKKRLTTLTPYGYYDWSPDSSKIVFAAGGTGNREIWVVNSDGSGLVQLTDNTAEDMYPQWSPDGTKIAFESNRAGSYDIWIMDADGSNQEQLTTDTAEDRNAEWAPDGTKIAFHSNRNGNFDIWVHVLQGSEPIPPSEPTSSLNTILENLEDGQHHVTVYATDLAGNMNSSTVYFTVDTTPPTVKIESPKNETYNETTIDLIATADENIEEWTYSLDGGEPITVTTSTSEDNAESCLYDDFTGANGDAPNQDIWSYYDQLTGGIVREIQNNELRFNSHRASQNPIGEALVAVKTVENFETIDVQVDVTHQSGSIWNGGFFGLVPADRSDEEIFMHSDIIAHFEDTVWFFWDSAPGDQFYAMVNAADVNDDVWRSPTALSKPSTLRIVGTPGDTITFYKDGELLHSQPWETSESSYKIWLVSRTGGTAGESSDTRFDNFAACGGQEDSPPTSTMNTILSDLSAGPHYVTVYATDLVGNENSSTVWFTVDGTPPDITISSPLPQDYSYTENITVAFNAVDEGSGVAYVNASFNGSEVFDGQEIVLFDLSIGEYALVVDAADNVGNKGAANVTFNIIDDIPPISIDNADGDWHNTTITLNLTAEDEKSAVREIHYKLNDGEEVTSVGDVTEVVIDFESDNNVITYFAVDVWDNAEEANTVAGIKLDKTPPTTTETIEGALLDNDWYTSDVTVTLTATDETSGVAATYYSLNGGEAVEDSSISITEEGEHTLTYYSVDVAGNIEEAQSITIKLDKTDPATTDDADADWHTEDITIALTATDESSGVAETYYIIYHDEVPQGTLTLSGDGQPIITYEDDDSWLEYWSVDAAGNEEEHAMVKEIKLDKTLPDILITSPEPREYSYIEDFTLDFDVTDTLSGIASTSANLDSTPVSSGDVVDLFDFSLEGHALEVKTTDIAGNDATEAVTFTVIDDVPPVSQDDADQEWHNFYLITLTSQDEKSTVREIHYIVNDESEVVEHVATTQVVIMYEDDNNTLEYWAVDEWGNMEEHHFIDSIKFDKTPPATTDDSNTNWHTSDITITLNSEDPVIQGTPSGVAETYYIIYHDEVPQGMKVLSVDGPPTITYEDDDNWLEYWSVDIAGNVEGHIMRKGIKLDKTRPVTSNDYNGMWYKQDITITLTANDETSGVAETYYTLYQDEAPQETKTLSTAGQPVITYEDDDNWLEYWSVDVAGNEEEHITVREIKLDKTKPTTFISLDGNMGTNDWYISDVYIHLTPEDSVSGIASTHYKLDEAEYQEGTSLSVSIEGGHNVSYYSLDIAGNKEENNSASFKIDKTAPELSITSPMPTNYVHSEVVEVIFTSTDDISGVYRDTIFLDDQEYDFANPIDLIYLSIGYHTIRLESENHAGLVSTESVEFEVIATPDGLIALINKLYEMGEIDNEGVKTSLIMKAKTVIRKVEQGQNDTAVNVLEAFVNELDAQEGKHISGFAAHVLKMDVEYLIGQYSQVDTLHQSFEIVDAFNQNISSNETGNASAGNYEEGIDFIGNISNQTTPIDNSTNDNTTSGDTADTRGKGNK